MVSYKNKNFNKDINYELNNREFVNCTFEGITFDNIWVSNVEFINCTFIDVMFNGGKFNYVQFRNCSYHGTSFEYTQMGNTIFNGTGIGNGTIYLFRSDVSNVVLKNIEPRMFCGTHVYNAKHSIHTMLPHLTADERWENGRAFKSYYIRYIDTYIDKQTEIIDGVKCSTLHYPIALPREQLEEFCEEEGLPKPPWVSRGILYVVDTALNGENG